jgi:STE24 endopeptidase
MLIVGGLLEILIRWAVVDLGTLQLIAMAGTLVVWGAGFGWVSRCFERQADVFSVRAITPDVELCSPDCAVHAVGGASGPAASRTGAGLCLGAALLFGRTLQRIADLNGIPRDAPSWRHGSIDSRCRLVYALADHPGALRRFDRALWGLKAGMVSLTLLGIAAAAWIYWPAQLFNR